ncbi:MAG: hypothetical protein HG432_013115 [Propionibacterium sp.]|nr:hypothetical protein [Propionibacterium sp.]
MTKPKAKTSMTKPKAKKSKRQRGPRTAADEAPLTAEQVIEAGVRLTAARGLAGWSTRDLAKEVGCWPTAIVHRVGPRHDVNRVIVDAVMHSVDLPSPELSWRPWYQQLLTSLHDTLSAHPGVARWLGMAATTVPAAVLMIDTGVSKLAEAGLGDEAPAAHIMLLNTALHLIASEDERDVDPKLQDAIIASLGVLSEDRQHPGAAMFADTLADAFDLDRLYNYAVERALDGVAARIATRQPIKP